jgi:hypothetical protein
MTEEQARKELAREKNNYVESLQALKALAHELSFNDDTNAIDENIRIYFGRRFDTSPKNVVSPKNTVTPDLVIQRNPTEGCVVEAKISIPKFEEHLDKILLEQPKYDDDLVGWESPNEKIANHDLVLITHLAHGNRIVERLQALQKAHKIRIGRNFSVIKWSLTDRADTFSTLEMVHGQIGDKRKARKLNNTILIPLARITENPKLSNIELYDAEPPEHFLMWLIHQSINQNLSEDEVEEMKRTGKAKVSINVDKLRARLSEECGPGEPGHRTPEIPKKAWVKRAMEHFVRIKWAERGETPNAFEFFVKERRKAEEQFERVCARRRVTREKKSKARDEDQLKLF